VQERPRNSNFKSIDLLSIKNTFLLSQSMFNSLKCNRLFVVVELHVLSNQVIFHATLKKTTLGLEPFFKVLL
jgi:hypothetical protein